MSLFIPPDWRDSEAYPAKADEWLLGPWVWAFLRRNPDYQKDYNHFASLPSYRANGAKTVKWHCTEVMWWDEPELRYCKQPIIEEDESLAHYFHRTGDDTPFSYSLEEHLIEKWEILYLEDPANDKGSHCIEFEISLPEIIEEKYKTDLESGERIPLLSEPEEFHEMTLRFDLRYSVDAQLLHAKYYLMERKEALIKGFLPFKEIRKSGINRNYLPKYLRAYDAYLAGATNLEIAAHLWPEQKVKIHKSKYDTNNSVTNNVKLTH